MRKKTKLVRKKRWLAVVVLLTVGLAMVLYPAKRSKFVSTGAFGTEDFGCKCLGYEYLEQRGAAFDTYLCKGIVYDCSKERGDQK